MASIYRIYDRIFFLDGFLRSLDGDSSRFVVARINAIRWCQLHSLVRIAYGFMRANLHQPIMSRELPNKLVLYCSRIVSHGNSFENTIFVVGNEI